MTHYEWPASDYALGAYIQATITDTYLSNLSIKSDDHCLDIGCGDGSYSTRILEKIPEGRLVGVDRSDNMLKLAAEKKNNFPNFSLQKSDVLDINFVEQFDYIVSFWCLHWCPDLTKAYSNIYRALKKGGKLFTLFPSGDDAFLSSFKFLKSTGEFPSLQNFKMPIDFQNVAKLPNVVAATPFKKAQVTIDHHSIMLPSLDIFRRFVNGLAFFHGQVPEDEIRRLNEALVKAYDLECQQKYQGKYQFDGSAFVVVAEK